MSSVVSVVLFIFIGFIVVGILFAVVFFNQNKSVGKQESASGEQSINKIDNEKEKDNNVLNDFYNTLVKNMLSMLNCEKCVNAVEKYLVSDADFLQSDYGIYILPNEYLNQDDELDDDIKVARMGVLQSFFKDKASKLNMLNGSCYAVEKRICNYVLNEIDCIIESFHLTIDEYDDECDDSFDRDYFICMIEDLDELGYKSGINSVNALYFGLNSLGILNNCSIESFYLLVGFKQEEYNFNKLNDLCSKCSIDYEIAISDVKKILSKVGYHNLSKYLMSHQNNAIYILLDNLCNSSEELDLVQILTLVLRQSYKLNYSNCISVADEVMSGYNKIKKAKSITSNLINDSMTECRISIKDVDRMNGIEFEIFIADMFAKLGYRTKMTKASGDQGVDVIAYKGEKILGIQAKCYSGVVGSHAIMEVVAGKNYYGCNSCMVITNSTFSAAAKELANVNHVELWDRNDLKEQIDLLDM